MQAVGLNRPVVSSGSTLSHLLQGGYRGVHSGVQQQKQNSGIKGTFDPPYIIFRAFQLPVVILLFLAKIVV